MPPGVIDPTKPRHQSLNRKLFRFVNAKPKTATVEESRDRNGGQPPHVGILSVSVARPSDHPPPSPPRARPFEHRPFGGSLSDGGMAWLERCNCYQQLVQTLLWPLLRGRARGKPNRTEQESAGESEKGRCPPGPCAEIILRGSSRHPLSSALGAAGVWLTCMQDCAAAGRVGDVDVHVRLSVCSTRRALCIRSLALGQHLVKFSQQIPSYRHGYSSPFLARIGGRNQNSVRAGLDTSYTRRVFALDD